MGIVFSILLTIILEDDWPLNKGCSIIIWPRYFIFCRYIFKNQKKAGLQELGPRFTLKLRSLQRGTFDSKFGEYEWVHKVCSIELLVLSITLRLCSHTLGYDSCWSLMWIHLFFKYSHQNLGMCPGKRLWPCVQALDGTVLAQLEHPVSEHNTIMCRCPGTSAGVPYVNTA